MKFFIFLIYTFINFISATNYISTNFSNNCTNTYLSNKCISFTVSSGTGCQWMCSYCASSLGTTNYYFTDNVCLYQSGGCVGNPQSGKTYTCCSV